METPVELVCDNVQFSKPGLNVQQSNKNKAPLQQGASFFYRMKNKSKTSELFFRDKLMPDRI